MITLDCPIAQTKAGQHLKVQRVPPEIKVHTVDGSGISGLHIYGHGHKAGKGVDSRHYHTDAKRIYAWMIWHLPGGTVECLRDLIVSKDVA
jgi:hypothetical protein